MNDYNLNKAIGQWLADHRKQKDLSQQQVADRLGVTKTAVHYWETGKRMIFAETMIDYCKILNLDPQDLVRDISPLITKEDDS
jgi:transcriptional regulator with XRE-family HTH domain